MRRDTSTTPSTEGLTPPRRAGEIFSCRSGIESETMTATYLRLSMEAAATISLRSRHSSPSLLNCLETISKWSDATVYGTIGARMRVVALRGSSTPSCRSEPRPHGIWIAMPASVPQPTGALDTACRQRRPASPHRCVGCAPDSRVQWQPHGLKDCHTLCPDTGVGALPRWAAVVRPQWHPGSPPTAWHRGRLLQQP